MKEILGNHLMHFMVAMSDHKDYERHQRTYKGDRYEVWEVSDDLFEDMCNMSEEKFVELAGKDAWWRSSIGSNLSSLQKGEIKVNGQIMQGWIMKPWDDYTIYEDEGMGDVSYESLSEYLCEVIGASQPRNVVSCAMDLAKYNNMTMGELFSKYEG